MKEVKSQDYSHNMFGLSNEVIKDISDVLKKHPNIDKVLIFGSRAKGNYTEGSDIDLVLIGQNISFNELLDINRDIPKIIKFKATNSLRVSCLFCIFKHSPQKTV